MQPLCASAEAIGRREGSDRPGGTGDAVAMCMSPIAGAAAVSGSERPGSWRDAVAMCITAREPREPREPREQ